MSYPPNPADANTRPTYLRNIHEALYLDANNNVAIRTGFTGDINVDTINIPGNVSATQSGTWTVDIGTIPEVEIKNDVGNAIPITGNVNATLTGSSSVKISGTNIDAFGRLRVSNPYTLWDSRTRYYNHNSSDTATSGSGTLTYNANASLFEMNVGTASGDSVIRETKRVFPYQPGKSLLILESFCMTAPKVNLRQRVGFFGAQNGIFFEAAGTTLNMVVRSSSSGSIVEDRIPQSQWNTDRLDGSGGDYNPSGITLNLALDQLFWMDIEWLGVGSVRCGFVIDGNFYVCHIFHHTNTPSTATANNTTTYMTTASLPIRFEITNTGTTASSSTMKQICATVMSEGGYVQRGTVEYAGTGVSAKRLSIAGTYYPIASIRLNSSRLDAIIIPDRVGILSTSVNYYRWVLLSNATLTGATWATSSSTGTVDIDTAATAVSGGTELESGFASSRETVELATELLQYQLGRTLAGSSDVVTLALASTSQNADVLAQLGWTEIT